MKEVIKGTNIHWKTTTPPKFSSSPLENAGLEDYSTPFWVSVTFPGRAVKLQGCSEKTLNQRIFDLTNPASGPATSIFAKPTKFNNDFMSGK